MQLQEDFSSLEIYTAIDKFGHGVVNADNLRVFLKEFACSNQVKHEELQGLIRRFDKNVDGGLTLNELICVLQPMNPAVEKNPAKLKRAIEAIHWKHQPDDETDTSSNLASDREAP